MSEKVDFSRSCDQFLISPKQKKSIHSALRVLFSTSIWWPAPPPACTHLKSSNMLSSLNSNMILLSLRSFFSPHPSSFFSLCFSLVRVCVELSYGVSVSHCLWQKYRNCNLLEYTNCTAPSGCKPPYGITHIQGEIEEEDRERNVDVEWDNVM